MVIRRLLPVFLVLFQSGLAAAHAHTHRDRANHSETPHIHVCELLEPFVPAHGDHEGDGGEHDSDAVDLSDMLAGTAPPTVDFVSLDLFAVDAGPVFEVSSPNPSPFPLGLPPPTAGPAPPLYLTHCSLTI